MTGADRLARAVFALLVLACLAAFLITQRLKHTPTVVQRFELTPRFSPRSVGDIKEERISFRLARRDEVTVTILNASEAEVATLVRAYPVQRYKQLSLRWNGRLGTPRGYTVLRAPNGHTSILPANHGPIAFPGQYRVRVSLREQHRTVLSPRSFALVSG